MGNVAEVKIKSVEYWTRKEFDDLPLIEWKENKVEFDSLVILPTRHIHDSGYRCMDFVAVAKNKPLYRLSGWSDVIHIDGIAGFGYDWLNLYNRCPEMIKPIAWSID